MAKQTPEGKVKKKLLDFLKSLGGDCFYYMPVQNGMGQTGIPDVMAIIKGVPFAFECKATPKQQPTVLQAYALDRIHKARVCVGGRQRKCRPRHILRERIKQCRKQQRDVR